jgi:uncharacterized protein (DUF1015 family)
MPQIRPIPAITYAPGDISTRIAPPYDVLNEASKARLLAQDNRNIVAIDLPHLPAKTVGPDATYEKAGQVYRQWLDLGELYQHDKPAIFAYQQTYSVKGKTFKRRGLITNIALQPFGPASDGKGGVFPHEQTFSGPKEDRLKLMKATQAQLSPIFGLHSDPQNNVHALLSKVIDASRPTFAGTTANDDVLHETWVINDPVVIAQFEQTLAGSDVYIADGHHRYTTALNYRQYLTETQGPLPADHPANFCLFVLIAMQDPGMIVLPTHRVLGGMLKFDFRSLVSASNGAIKLTPFPGTGTVEDLAKLEAALPSHGPHAIGVYSPADAPSPLAILTTTDPDPLKTISPQQSDAWRQLDVAIVQHLIVEKICQPKLCEGGTTISWKFPHTLEEVKADTETPGYQVALIVQPTPLESVRLVSEANELMPQKSTFFYPKLATGLVINPLA